MSDESPSNESAGDTPETDDLTWETHDRSTVYTCEAFDVVNEAVSLHDGTDAEYDFLADGESVVVLPFTTDGDVVVIDEWRHPVRRVNRGLPAGSMDESDDDPAEAVARELEEETGYVPGDVRHLTTAEPANAVLDSVFHYFVAEDCEPTGERDLDYNESIRVETTTFDALVEAARDGELRDGRSMFGVVYYALFEGQ
jgi:ADP-ribose pyrophosphatase